MNNVLYLNEKLLFLHFFVYFVIWKMKSLYTFFTPGIKKNLFGLNYKSYWTQKYFFHKISNRVLSFVFQIVKNIFVLLLWYINIGRLLVIKCCVSKNDLHLCCVSNLNYLHYSVCALLRVTSLKLQGLVNSKYSMQRLVNVIYSSIFKIVS